MIKQGARKHRYVSLLSVLMVYFAGLALLAILIFLAAFIYRMVLNSEAYEADPAASGVTYDLFNLSNNFNSYILIGSLFAIAFMLIFLLFRAIYTLNHPTTIMVTLQYVNANGDMISITREVEAPKVKEATASAKKVAGERFQKLTLLDKQYPKKEHITSTEGLTLEYICRRFRSFASHIEGNPLFYSIDDIRRFITSLGVSKIIVLQGMSGTGKTSLPVAWGKFTKVPTTVVPVQPMWKERSDLIGYFNEFTGKFNESMILEKLYEAN